MTKEEFLKSLRTQLKRGKVPDYQDYVDDYSELIDDRLEVAGATEQSILTELDSPTKIARAIIDEDGQPGRRISTGLTVWMVILIILGSPVWVGLLIAAVSLIATAYLLLWLIPFLIGVFDFSFFITGAVGVVASFVAFFATGAAYGVTQLGISILCIGIALIGIKLLWWITKGFAVTTRNSSLWIINSFRR